MQTTLFCLNLTSRTMFKFRFVIFHVSSAIFPRISKPALDKPHNLLLRHKHTLYSTRHLYLSNKKCKTLRASKPLSTFPVCDMGYSRTMSKGRTLQNFRPRSDGMKEIRRFPRWRWASRWASRVSSCWSEVRQVWEKPFVFEGRR